MTWIGTFNTRCKENQDLVEKVFQNRLSWTLRVMLKEENTLTPIKDVPVVMSSDTRVLVVPFDEHSFSHGLTLREFEQTRLFSQTSGRGGPWRTHGSLFPHYKVSNLSWKEVLVWVTSPSTPEFFSRGWISDKVLHVMIIHELGDHQ